MYDELVKELRHIDEFATETNRPTSGIFKEAADAIEELTALSSRQEVELVELTGELASKPRWIPVSERLPEDRQSVLVHRDDGGIFIFEYFTTSPTDECWIDDHLNVYSAYCVTHWMPLPEPPKEE